MKRKTLNFGDFLNECINEESYDETGKNIGVEEESEESKVPEAGGGSVEEYDEEESYDTYESNSPGKFMGTKGFADYGDYSRFNDPNSSNNNPGRVIGNRGIEEYGDYSNMRDPNSRNNNPGKVIGARGVDEYGDYSRFRDPNSRNNNPGRVIGNKGVEEYGDYSGFSGSDKTNNNKPGKFLNDRVKRFDEALGGGTGKNKPGLEISDFEKKVIKAIGNEDGKTTMQVKTALGEINIVDVHNVLTEMTKKGKIIKKTVGGDSYWFLGPK